MMTNEVPIVTSIGRPRTNVSAGTMRNPPPTPSSPVRNPTTAPVASALGRQLRQLTPPPGRAQGPPADRVGRNILTPAMTMITANAPSSTRWSSIRFTIVPR